MARFQLFDAPSMLDWSQPFSPPQHMLGVGWIFMRNSTEMLTMSKSGYRRKRGALDGVSWV